jgi:hypothetical protein
MSKPVIHARPGTYRALSRLALNAVHSSGFCIVDAGESFEVEHAEGERCWIRFSDCEPECYFLSESHHDIERTGSPSECFVERGLTQDIWGDCTPYGPCPCTECRILRAECA